MICTTDGKKIRKIMINIRVADVMRNNANYLDKKTSKKIVIISQENRIKSIQVLSNQFLCLVSFLAKNSIEVYVTQSLLQFWQQKRLKSNTRVCFSR